MLGKVHEPEMAEIDDFIDRHCDDIVIAVDNAMLHYWLKNRGYDLSTRDKKIPPQHAKAMERAINTLASLIDYDGD